MKTLPAHENYTDVVFREGFELTVDNESQLRGAFVLIHGLTGTPAEMEGLADFLWQRGFNVIVPRLSGHAGNLDEFRTMPAMRWLADSEQALDRASELAKGKPVFAAGLSFGSLLVLYLASLYPEKISAAICMSAPLHLKSLVKEALLNSLSFLPDAVLNKFSTVLKSKRPDGCLAVKRHAYPVHSIAASARIMWIRRQVFNNLSSLRCPVLILQGSADHHLAANTCQALREMLARHNPQVSTYLVPDGQHELVLGHSFGDVFAKIGEFVDGVLKRSTLGVP